jgi:hypothetical protein
MELGSRSFSQIGSCNGRPFQAFTACSALIGLTVIPLAFINFRVLSYHLDFADRLFATSRSSCEQSSKSLLCTLAIPGLVLPLSIFLAIGHRWSKGHKEAYGHY